MTNVVSRAGNTKKGPYFPCDLSGPPMLIYSLKPLLSLFENLLLQESLDIMLDGFLILCLFTTAQPEIATFDYAFCVSFISEDLTSKTLGVIFVSSIF